MCIQQINGRLTEDFATALEAALDAETPETDGEPSPPPPPREVLDAGGIVGGIFWQRIRDFFARLFGR